MWFVLLEDIDCGIHFVPGSIFDDESAKELTEAYLDEGVKWQCFATFEAAKEWSDWHYPTN